MAKKLSIKPIGGNILVKPIKPEEKTTSGLIIQTNKDEKSQKGEIVALGTGQRDESGKAVNPVDNFVSFFHKDVILVC